jgi:hypothetical protein
MEVGFRTFLGFIAQVHGTAGVHGSGISAAVRDGRWQVERGRSSNADFGRTHVL